MENKPTIAKIFDVAEDYRPLGRPVQTAVKDFDDKMDGGLRGGELITFSGLTGHGKTSYALWLTKQIVDSGVPCLWFTYEMNPWYLKQKLEALGAKEGFATFVPIKHDDNSMEWILAKIKEAQERYGCKIFFIDHLHYIIPDNVAGGNIPMAIGSLVRKLKTMAVETDTIVVLIAHMTDPESGERISMRLIRDSKLVSRESDYVYLIERIKKKKPKANRRMDDTPEVNPMEDDDSSVSKILLAKNRRTGDKCNRFFEVSNGNFRQLSINEVNDYKETLEL